MTTSTATVSASGLTEAAVETLVLELLGDLLKKDPDDLRQQLVDKGEGMPVDSLDLLDILVEFRKRTGLRIPKRKLRRNTMRSVHTFAQFAAREGKK